MSKEVKPVKVEVKKAEPVRGSTPWTADIRETHKGELTTEHLDALFAEYRKQDREVTQLYCRQEQAEKIRELGGYEDVTLTVE